MGILRTLYLVFKSLLSGELIIIRRTCDGAWKCRFLFFRREDETILLNFILKSGLQHSMNAKMYVQEKFAGKNEVLDAEDWDDAFKLAIACQG